MIVKNTAVMPYLWPQKNDWEKAVEAWKRYRSHKNDNLFKKELLKILHTPFQHNASPSNVPGFTVTGSDLTRLGLTYPTFLVCTGNMGEFGQGYVEFFVDQHACIDDCVLKISLKK